MLNLIIVQFVSISFTIPSLLLYLLECWFIFNGRNNKFGGSFYKIFLLSAVNNILFNFVQSLATFRVASFSALFAMLASVPTWLSCFVFALYYYHLHIENILTLLALVHRLSAIVKPMKYEKVWKKLLPFLTVLSFLLPLICVYHIFFIEIRWVPYTTNGEEFIGLTYDHKIYSNAPSNSKITFIVSTTFLILCLLVNFVILAAYKRANARNDGSSGEHNAKIEFRLMTYTLLIFLIQALICLYWIAVYLFQFDDALFIQLYGHYILLNDARAVWFPAWFLLWASSDTRQAVHHFVCWVPKIVGPSGGGAAAGGGTLTSNAGQQRKIMPIKNVVVGVQHNKAQK